MTSSESDRSYRPADLTAGSWIMRLGRIGVACALLSAVATLLIFADYAPIRPTTDVVLALFALNGLLIIFLIVLLGLEIWRLNAARKAQAAGARLHIRIVALFSIIAAVPAIIIAGVGTITLERTLNPAFMQDVRGFILNTGEAARLFSETQCRALLRETRLTAADIERIEPLFRENRKLFLEIFETRAKFLAFSSAALIKTNGEIVERATAPTTRIVMPEPSDFEEAQKDSLTCLLLDEGRTFVTLQAIATMPDTFLYAERAVDPFAVEFPRQAQALISLYDAYDAHRRNIQIAFATMYALIALIMLLSAMWMGLSFANRLALPIRRLIAATDQVSAGNLYVQVPTNRSEGDFARLGDTFNNMTSELRLQQNRLLAASRLNDQRRLFTEAVLSGVPAGVIGIDGQGRITVMNAYAHAIADDLGAGKMEERTGKEIGELIPELTPMVEAASQGAMRIYQGQITLNRRGRERIFNVRIAHEQSNEQGGNRVVTLDDITDFVTAQRTSAWADVARRIAHEIKNPLTPIQLSAERLKRKYGRVITEDREIFDQCTNTIVRQVDDIKRMVDEFSSFARMPKARLEEDDLNECVKQVVFLMRVGHPDITFEERLPEAALHAYFDRRLLSQALTNIIKNATEGIKGAQTHIADPKIVIALTATVDDLVNIDVIDNGKGFPKENRQRLLEPYMTTRSEGTGLGLAIVAKILEDHGGGIELLDAPEGKGAWVRLWFAKNKPGGAQAPIASASVAQ